MGASCMPAEEVETLVAAKLTTTTKMTTEETTTTTTTRCHQKLQQLFFSKARIS